jgi:hypothetical protein
LQSIRRDEEEKDKEGKGEEEEDFRPLSRLISPRLIPSLYLNEVGGKRRRTS